MTPLPPHGRVRCIGDVHGQLDAFAPLVAEARATGRFVLQLGDIVDYGPDSPGCLRLMLDLVEAREGLFLRGNHEDKFRRHLAGRPVTVDSGGLGQTLEQMARAPDRAYLEHRFVAGWESAPYWVAAPRHLFVHGAFSPEMLAVAQPDLLTPRKLADKVRALALYGQTDGTMDEEGRPVRLYDWVDSVPRNLTVVVGHDIRSRQAPVVRKGALGGTAVFLDTGCGKGGTLSWMDLTLA